MKLLLDTHAFIWFYSGSKELSNHSKMSIDNLQNECFLSLASLWEISIKWSLGKMDINAPTFDDFCQDALKGIEVLPVNLPHVQKIAKLAYHHRDPFDRILIAQALTEEIAVVTKDPLFTPYAEDEHFQIIW